jgi:hypothetical protein
VQFVDATGTYVNKIQITGTTFDVSTIQLTMPGQTFVATLPSGNQAVAQPGSTNLVINNLLISENLHFPDGSTCTPGSCSIGATITATSIAAAKVVTISSSSGTHYVGTTTTPAAGLVDKQEYIFVPGTGSASTTPDLAINGFAAKVIAHGDGSALVSSGELAATGICIVMYDQTSDKFLLLNGMCSTGPGYTKNTCIAASSVPNAASSGILNFFCDSSNSNQPSTKDSTGKVTTALTRIFTGTATLGTSSINSGACATVVTVGATGTLTTDIISFTPNADITAVTGYAPVTAGGLAIYPYPTADNANFKVCNPTSSSITPGAVTLNFMVTR